MQEIRAYRFRIYPDEKRAADIDNRIILAQRLYNKILEKAKEGYEKDKVSRINLQTLNRYMKEAISEDKRYLRLYSQTRQDIFIRLQRAFQNFFRRVKEKREGKRKRAGFPRFKSSDRYSSITYPQYNGSFSIEKNRLRIARIGTMRIEQHRAMKGTVKRMTIKKEAGRYYAIFTAISEVEIPKVSDTNPIGIDMGLDSFIVLSDGAKVKKPAFFKKCEKRISHWQRVIAKRKRGSKRRQRSKAKLQNEWFRVSSQSNDFMHKLSNTLINSRYTSFAVESLNIQGMVRNHSLAQSIYNASWNRFIQMLSYKAESAGMEVTKVDARNTTRTCSNCGNIRDMQLSERTYACARCGMRKDRDINAAVNILNRAREGHSRSNAQGESVRPQREAVLGELRTYSVTNNGGSPRL